MNSYLILEPILAEISHRDFDDKDLKRSAQPAKLNVQSQFSKSLSNFCSLSICARPSHSLSEVKKNPYFFILNIFINGIRRRLELVH